MSGSENESYHSDSEEDNNFEEESDYSDGEDSLDPELEPTFKPRIKIGSKIDADLGGDSEDEDEDDTELGIENEELDEEDEKEKQEEVDGEQIASPFGLAINEDEIQDVESDTDYEDTEEEDEEDEDFLQKFDQDTVEDYIGNMHPESKIHNYDEVKALTNVIRNPQGAIIDDLHTTIPVLTKYEKTRVLGLRGKQLDAGAQPFVKVPDTVIDGYTIALMELKQKLIPFVIRRPLPNGGCEYWKVSDLELP